MTQEELQEFEQILSECYDESGMPASQKGNVLPKASAFFQHLINIEQGVEEEGEKTFELSDDLLFNGLLAIGEEED